MVKVRALRVYSLTFPLPPSLLPLCIEMLSLSSLFLGLAAGPSHQEELIALL